MRRRQIFLSIAFAASMAGGCLGSGGYGSPSDPSGSQTPSNGGGASDNGNSSGSSSSGSSSGAAGASGSAGSSGSTGAGGSSGTVDPPTPPPPPAPPAKTGSIAMTVDKTTDTVRLNETKSYVVTITPADGFAGSVNLAAEGLAAGMTATFNSSDPAVTAAITSVNVMSTAPVTVKMSVAVASDMATPAASVPVSVKGTSGTITASANLGVMIPAELLVQIPANLRDPSITGSGIGTAAAPQKNAFGTTDVAKSAYGMPVIQVAAGTKVTWVNLDSINHRVHSDGGQGIAHEPDNLLANGANTYTQTFKSAGTFSYRCHIHPNMLGQIVVK
jgi:plastocyanin